MNYKNYIFCVLIILIGEAASSQITLPFEQTLRIEQERNLLDDGQTWHPVYPFTKNINEQASIYRDLSAEKPVVGEHRFRNWLNRKLFYESLIRVDTGGFKLTIDPMVYFEVGREYNYKQTSGEDNAVRKTWVNTRGVNIDGVIGQQFAFHSAFFESQAVLPSWADKQARELLVVPGQAMYKDFKGTGFDYAFAEGHISYSPSRYFNFRLGQGKNFIGEGYRSLLLSDVAFNYPYLAITTKVWHIEYVNIYSELQDIRAPKGDWHPWQKKYTTTHYLSWNVLPWLNVGLFESIVWQASDSTQKRGFDINYLNPVIFYRPVEFSLGSPDNALLGGALRFTVLKRNIIYTQLMLDEFKLEHVIKGDGWWANKHGFQLGIKSFDPFGLRNLYLQAEYNHVRPYTYAHNSPLQNYAHYNQPLAHPQGANFRELVLIADQRIHRFRFGTKLVYTTYGADTAGMSYGHDLYRSYYDFVNEFGNKIGQGLKTTMIQYDLNAGWIVNAATNLTLNAGLTMRHTFSEADNKGNILLSFGIRSALFNRYYDF